MAAAESEPAGDGDIPGPDETLGDTLLLDAEPVDGTADQIAEQTAVDDVLPEDAAETQGSKEALTLKLPNKAMQQSTKSVTTRTQKLEATAQREEWKRLGEQVKPSHLRVPSGIYHIVDRLVQPVRKEPEDVVEPPPRHGTGPMEPRSNIEPTVVRSFIHRMDRNHDDLIEPKELSELSVRKSLGISGEQIQSMFERIMECRPPGKRHHQGISWLEVYNEMKVTKRWMWTIDLSVMCQDGELYHVTTEREHMERWCSAVQAELSSDYPDLECQSSWSTSEIGRFVSSVLSAKSKHDGRLLQCEPRVQALLKMQSDKLSNLTLRPRKFASVTVAGEREAWGWDAQPYRALWLRFFHAVGLKPLQPVEPESGKAAAKAQEDARIKIKVPENVASAPKKSHASNEGKVRVREARPKVMVREGQDPPLRQRQNEIDLLHPSEEKRLHSEALINGSISKGIASCTASADNDPGAPITVPDPADLANTSISVSFDARQRFQQVHGKQVRDSEQQRSIGKERQDMQRQASLRAAGASVANAGIKFRGPNYHLGFSTHHLTNSVEPSRLKYQKELGHSWDGTHLDHSRMPPQKEDVKLSKMTQEERANQFCCYYVKKDSQAVRVAALEGVKDINDSYTTWQNHEFRHDQPHRHGKYGRRVFDPQVRETALGQNISGIDNKPMEEFLRQQDLVHEFLDRSLPPNQAKHFDPYHPRSDMPRRKEVSTTGQEMMGMGNYI